MEFLKSRLKSEEKKKSKLPRKDQLVIFLLFGILLVVIAIPSKPGAKEGEALENAGSREEFQEEGTQEASYEKRQEGRLKEALEQVEGVGRAEVMITLKSSLERVVAKDKPYTGQNVEEEDSQGGKRSTREESWSESTVYQEEAGGRTPYVVKELEPQVEGVIVIAEGGGNAAVRQNILEAVQALFPVEAHKIKIMKMEGSK